MRKEYDFSKMKSRRNPYAGRLKKPVTIRLGMDVVEYFKALSEKMGMPFIRISLICICVIVLNLIGKLPGLLRMK